MKKFLYPIIIFVFAVSPLRAKRNLGYYLAGQAFEGLALYSWLVPMGLKLEGKTAAGVGLLTPMVWTGASFVNSLTASKITGGMALSSLYGGLSGAIQGALVGDSASRGTFSLLGSIFENVGNFHLFNTLQLNSASAQRWENFANLGLFHVALFDQFKSSSLLYGAASIVESYGSIPVFKNDRHATWGDAFFEMLSSSTMLGSVWLISLGVDEAALDKHDGYRIVTGLGFSTLGYGAGYYLSGRRDLSTGGALFTLFVPTMIDMMATGTIVLLSGSDNAALITSGLLLPFGVYGSYFLFSKREIGANSNGDTGRLKLMLNPVSGAMVMLKNKINTGLNSMPVLTVEYSF